MYLKPMIIAGAVLFAGAAFAQGMHSSPGASGFSPGHQMQTKGSKRGSPGASGFAPGHQMHRKGARAGSPGASGYAPGHEMQRRNTGMSNSTGNMNTKGTGRGTTGTGGAGGSGNK